MQTLLLKKLGSDVLELQKMNVFHRELINNLFCFDELGNQMFQHELIIRSFFISDNYCTHSTKNKINIVMDLFLMNTIYVRIKQIK